MKYTCTVIKMEEIGGVSRHTNHRRAYLCLHWTERKWFKRVERQAVAVVEGCWIYWEWLVPPPFACFEKGNHLGRGREDWHGNCDPAMDALDAASPDFAAERASWDEGEAEREAAEEAALAKRLAEVSEVAKGLPC